MLRRLEAFAERMDDLARNIDAMKLAERLHGVKREELWLHLESEGPLEKYPGEFCCEGDLIVGWLLMRECSEATCTTGA